MRVWRLGSLPNWRSTSVLDVLYSASSVNSRCTVNNRRGDKASVERFTCYRDLCPWDDGSRDEMSRMCSGFLYKWWYFLCSRCVRYYRCPLHHNTKGVLLCDMLSLATNISIDARFSKHRHEWFPDNTNRSLLNSKQKPVEFLQYYAARLFWRPRQNIGDGWREQDSSGLVFDCIYITVMVRVSKFCHRSSICHKTWSTYCLPVVTCDLAVCILIDY